MSGRAQGEQQQQQEFPQQQQPHPSRQSPSPTHGSNANTNPTHRPSIYTHKRRDSDTLRSVPPPSASPTAIDLPPRLSPSARSLAGVNAALAKHRRSPTAPEPPTTSGMLAPPGSGGNGVGKTWAAGDGDDYGSGVSDRERERDRDRERREDRERSKGQQQQQQHVSMQQQQQQYLQAAPPMPAPAPAPPPAQLNRHMVVRMIPYPPYEVRSLTTGVF